MATAIDSIATSESVVFVVDDDEYARDSVCALVQSMGIKAEGYSSAEEFLTSADSSRPGCLVTDIRMLGMSGLELQEELIRKGCDLPVIVITAHARTPITVRAMKNGAVAFLDKPYAENDLWDAIRECMALDAARRAERAERLEIAQRFGSLSPKELRVLDLVVDGLPNKTIARQLDVSLRTVENRRRQIFLKMQVGSVAELVRLVMRSRSSIHSDVHSS